MARSRAVAVSATASRLRTAMSVRRAFGLLVATCCVLVLGACGGEEGSGSAPPPQTQGATNGEDCGNAKVPGHEAIGIRATGTECDSAKEVASDAEGRGRAPYESGGFACEPSEAGGGDTNYSCSAGSAKVTFRYGTS